MIEPNVAFDTAKLIVNGDPHETKDIKRRMLRNALTWILSPCSLIGLFVFLCQSDNWSAMMPMSLATIIGIVILLLMIPLAFLSFYWGYAVWKCGLNVPIFWYRNSMFDETPLLDAYVKECSRYNLQKEYRKQVGESPVVMAYLYLINTSYAYPQSLADKFSESPLFREYKCQFEQNLVQIKDDLIRPMEEWENEAISRKTIHADVSSFKDVTPHGLAKRSNYHD